jgi:cytidylate kinase
VTHRFTIAIDGPAAAGKSTIGEIVATRLDAVYFDTGILYRALTVLAHDSGVDIHDARLLAELAQAMDVRVERSSVADGRQVDVVVNGIDITARLRSAAVDRDVSIVSAHAEVRRALLDHQRQIGRSGAVVMVGRDIGTVVMPDAELKVFLDASPEERARRRLAQLERSGVDADAGTVLSDMRRRDHIDSDRDVAPLRPAADALVVDTDHLTIDQVVDAIVRVARQRLPLDGALRS